MLRYNSKKDEVLKISRLQEGIHLEDRFSGHRYLFHQGTERRAYTFMGAHPAGPGKDDGIEFIVYAPRAVSVSLTADFNGWRPGATPLKQLDDDPTLWVIRTAEIGIGDLYKFAIEDDRGNVRLKADPYAFESEKGTVNEGHMMASRVTDIAYGFRWGEEEERWMERRGRRNPYKEPMNIYEVHAGSWKRGRDGSAMGFREAADVLVRYVKSMGYTHIELLPVMEFPYEGSWGYQITGYYSVSSRYGSPEDFKYFVKTCHRNGIGVILDWVPAHFPRDAHGLAEFDGYPLYEDPDPFRKEHRGWGTLAFDFGRPEVRSFLISNAYFYLDVYHADGLRVDAVAAMLYLNYDRKEGEWRPNKYGGNENIEAVSFLRELNRSVLTDFPGALMIAEESTTWPLVTKPPESGGLGFNFKWNMGWMNDTLSYFATDPLFRGGAHNRLTFSMTYAYSENYILPVSHDEVVHGKRSLLSKMPGEYEKKFDGLRSFCVYMMTHPGKKLLFMGSEFGQFIEWDENKELDWMLLDYEKHEKMRHFVRELNHVYREHPALWESDDTPEGFRWIDADNSRDSTYSYIRRSETSGEELAVILNLSGRDFESYDIGVPAAEYYERVIDSDMKAYGGRGVRRGAGYPVTEGARNGEEQHITMALPALSGIILVKRGEPCNGCDSVRNEAV